MKVVGEQEQGTEAKEENIAQFIPWKEQKATVLPALPAELYLFIHWQQLAPLSPGNEPTPKQS